MSYLIQIDEKTGQILHPEVLKLCDSFMALSEKEMLYVALFADYSSIYHQLPEHDRRRRAMWHAFNENEFDLIETPRILAAVDDYKSLQHDPKKELILRYQKKIDAMLNILDEETTPNGIEKATKAIKSLRENIVSLQTEVNEQAKADGVIKGDRQLSFLEKKKSNKKDFKAITSKR